MTDPTIHLNGVNMANLTGTPTLMRVTATSGLKLRSAPAGDVLRTLAFEEQVTAFLDSAVTSPESELVRTTWVLVRDKDGTVGWTAKQYLAPLAEPPVTVTYTEAQMSAIRTLLDDIREHLVDISSLLNKGAPSDSGGTF